MVGIIAAPGAGGITQSESEDGGQRKTKAGILEQSIISGHLGAHHPLSVSLQDAQKLRIQPTWRASEAKTPDLSCTYPQPLPALPLPMPSSLPRAQGLA